MDSDFQKYRFMNIKINPFQSLMQFYLFIAMAWSIFLCVYMEYISFQSKNNIIVFCVHREYCLIQNCE